MMISPQSSSKYVGLEALPKEIDHIRLDSYLTIFDIIYGSLCIKSHVIWFKSSFRNINLKRQVYLNIISVKIPFQFFFASAMCINVKYLYDYLRIIQGHNIKRYNYMTIFLNIFTTALCYSPFRFLTDIPLIIAIQWI